jgi:alkylation response protein AidB-like acyl-CoA dehydrogenase
MGTTATETDDGFVLNGQKMWISNAHVADVSLVYAYTDKSKKHKGISCFLVDLKNTPGIKTAPIETKLIRVNIRQKDISGMQNLCRLWKVRPIFKKSSFPVMLSNNRYS